MENPIVSIIVPCYNQGVFLPETLDSVSALEYGEWECIIVNDGSTDNTEIVANEYCRKDKRFKYIFKENGGLSSARNKGIESSKGKYILPLDSDDKIAPSYVGKAVKLMESDNKLEIVYCKADMFGMKKGEWKLPEYSIEQILGENCIFCSAFFRRETYDAIGGYRSNMKFSFEDWDFWLGIIEKKGPDCVCRIDEVLFYYRIRKKSMIRSLDMSKAYDMRKQLWENHKNLYSENFMSPINTFEYRLISNSREYKIGCLLLKPIRFIVNCFRK